MHFGSLDFISGFVKFLVEAQSVILNNSSISVLYLSLILMTFWTEMSVVSVPFHLRPLLR